MMCVAAMHQVRVECGEVYETGSWKGWHCWFSQDLDI